MAIASQFDLRTVGWQNCHPLGLCTKSPFRWTENLACFNLENVNDEILSLSLGPKISCVCKTKFRKILVMPFLYLISFPYYTSVILQQQYVKMPVFCSFLKTLKRWHHANQSSFADYHTNILSYIAMGFHPSYSETLCKSEVGKTIKMKVEMLQFKSMHA